MLSCAPAFMSCAYMRASHSSTRWLFVHVFVRVGHAHSMLLLAMHREFVEAKNWCVCIFCNHVV